MPMIDNDGAKIEAMLEPLIAEHGIETVLAHLEVLFGGTSGIKWPDYQRVQSIARNVSNRQWRRL